MTPPPRLPVDRQRLGRLAHAVACLAARVADRLDQEALAPVVAKPGRYGRGLPPAVRRRVLAYIETHLEGPIPVPTLARVAGMSHTHFCHLFRAAMGQTAQAYVARCRVARAQTLLRTTDTSILQIALRVGYTTHTSLIDAFHRHLGITPRAYRLLRIQSTAVLRCLLCDRYSANPHDIAQRFCGWCYVGLEELSSEYRRPEEAAPQGKADLGPS